MLYRDFDIVLMGSRIRIVPMNSSDAEPYARLILGDIYDRLDDVPETALPSVLAHEAPDETHAIRPMDNDTFIGWITLQRDEDRPDIGIHLIPEQQNQGIGPEAILLFANYLRDTYGLKKVFFRTHETNKQCQRALDNTGAILYKTIPDPKEVALLACMPEKMRTKPMNVLYYHLDLA